MQEQKRDPQSSSYDEEPSTGRRLTDKGRAMANEAFQVMGKEVQEMHQALLQLVKNPAEGTQQVYASVKNHQHFAIFAILTISLISALLISLNQSLMPLFASTGAASPLATFFRAALFLILFATISSGALSLVRKLFLGIKDIKWQDDFFITALAMFPLVPGSLVTLVLWVLFKSPVVRLFFLFSAFLTFLLVFNGLKFICKVKDGQATYSISITYILTILLLVILEKFAT